MPLSPDDERLLESMKQRELNLKKRQRAANAVYIEGRRYRLVLILMVALAFAALTDAVFIIVCRSYMTWVDLWRPAIVVLVMSLAVGGLAGPGLVQTSVGRRLLTKKDGRLNEKYSGDLHAGRRWAQFYYQGEDISAYIGQLLYTIESEGRFDSVDEALAFAKSHSRESAAFRARGLALFNEVAAQTNLLVIASADAAGRPSSRFMRFVKSELPGVWYMTTAPDSPKVHELDRGRVALTTAPTPKGATISSNRVSVRRAGKSFVDVAPLFRAQAPRYLDGMTAADQERELVFELTLGSAKVDSWVDHELVVFDHTDRRDPVAGDAP